MINPKNIILSSFLIGASLHPSIPLDDKYQIIADQIINEIHKDSTAYNRLAYLCDTFGPRLSGSKI